MQSMYMFDAYSGALFVICSAIYTMNQPTRYICVRSHIELQDDLSLLVERINGWMSVGYHGIYVDYHVPADRAYIMYMLDHQLTREDYIV